MFSTTIVATLRDEKQVYRQFLKETSPARRLLRTQLEAELDVRTGILLALESVSIEQALMTLLHDKERCQEELRQAQHTNSQERNVYYIAARLDAIETVAKMLNLALMHESAN